MSYSTVVSDDGIARGEDLARRDDELDSLCLQDLGFPRTLTGPAEHGTDSGTQLLGAKGLGEVVVGAGIETGDAIDLGRAGSQHDHRHLALASHQSQELESVEARHHHVEQHQIVLAGQRPAQSAAAVVHGFQTDVSPGEELLQELAQLDVVVDHQDRHAGLCWLPVLLRSLPRKSCPCARGGAADLRSGDRGFRRRHRRRATGG